MKYLKMLLLATFPFTVFSQSPLHPVNVPIHQYNKMKVEEGLLYLPQNYASTTENYPVVIFYPGTGVTNRSQLSSQALPQLLSNGMKLEGIVNPADGKQYSFIVLSTVNTSRLGIPSQIRWLKENYRIDTNRIYLTGLSAGATIAMQAAATHDSISQYVTSVVAMSTPAPLSAINSVLVNTYKIKTLQYSGSSDSYTQGARFFETTYNAAYPNSSKLNIYNGGHCCWTTYYNVNYNDPTSGYSIWEWMLTNTKATTPITTLPVKFKSIKITKNKK